MIIENLIAKLANRQDLSYDEIKDAMDAILKGSISDVKTAEFLKHLTTKSETDDELLGMLDKMQEFAVHIAPKNEGVMIDVCGTGGDNMSTFNISTAAAFVIAASGGIVAKHGNRSVSSVLGSADIFEYFGYDLDSSPQYVTKIIERFGIGFMFAQKFHPAMKNVAKARKLVGGRTAFNLLGPLTNPAQVNCQMIGVFSENFLERLPLLLKKRKRVQNIMTVRSQDGLDELSTTSKNHVCFLKNGNIESITFDPQKLGLQKAKLDDIRVHTKGQAISAFVSVLNNTANQSMIETVALNAAGGLMVANIAKDFQQGIEIALDNIKNGKVYSLFKNFVGYCGDPKKIAEVEQS